VVARKNPARPRPKKMTAAEEEAERKKKAKRNKMNPGRPGRRKAKKP
jgi:hypothetical protein